VKDKLAMNKQKENGVNLCRATEVPLIAITGGQRIIGVLEATASGQTLPFVIYLMDEFVLTMY